MILYVVNHTITDFTDYLTAFGFLDQELISYRFSSCSSLCCYSCWSELFKKNLKLCRCKSDRDEIWQDCSSSKCTSVDGVGFLMLRHSFKMAAVTSFYEKEQKLPHKMRRNVLQIQCSSHPKRITENETRYTSVTENQLGINSDTDFQHRKIGTNRQSSLRLTD